MENQQTHNEIMRSLGNMEGKLDSVIKQLEKINGSIGRIDTEIDTINQWRANLVGRMGILTVFIGTIVSAIIAILSK